jgi:hypothetical protein
MNKESVNLIFDNPEGYEIYFDRIQSSIGQPQAA